MSYLCLSKRTEMRLPQHIIDLVGTLFDEGMDDEKICLAVLKTWEKMKLKTSEKITDLPGTVSGMPG